MKKPISVQKAKDEISLVQYLAHYGFHPVGRTGNRHQYLSPFRDEKKPSMFVDDEAGLWNDFGGGGGSIIDLAIELQRLPSVKKALEHLVDFVGNDYLRHNSQNFQKDEILIQGKESGIKNIRIKPLQHFVLLKYLREERGIYDTISQKYLRLITYDNRDRKNLFAMGWKNDSGDWELRSAGKQDFKAVTGKKDLTTIHGGGEQCFLFESMIDFLSILVLKNVDHLDGTVIILNSTSLINRVIPFLESQNFQTIYSLFDNDKAGKDATEKLINSYNHPDIRRQTFYHPHKDVNEYLVDKYLKQSRSK